MAPQRPQAFLSRSGHSFEAGSRFVRRLLFEPSTCRLEESGPGRRGLTTFGRTLMLATTVESTTLAAVDYDSARQLLWLRFRTHALYCYFDVPAAIYQAPLQADSKRRLLQPSHPQPIPLP